MSGAQLTRVNLCLPKPNWTTAVKTDVLASVIEVFSCILDEFELISIFPRGLACIKKFPQRLSGFLKNPEDSGEWNRSVFSNTRTLTTWHCPWSSAGVAAERLLCVAKPCAKPVDRYHHFICPVIHRMTWGGSVAEWLACWTQAQKGLGSNRSCDAVG